MKRLINSIVNKFSNRKLVEVDVPLDVYDKLKEIAKLCNLNISKVAEVLISCEYVNQKNKPKTIYKKRVKKKKK